MTLTIDIRPEVKAELARQAGLAGQALELYAAELLGDAVHLPVSKDATSGGSLVEVCAKVRGVLTDGEIETLFRRTPSLSRPVDFE